MGWLVCIYKFLLPLPPQPPTQICLISVWRLPPFTHPGRNLKVRIWQYYLNKAKKADQIESARLDKYNQLNWTAIMSRIIESCSDFKCHLSMKGFNSSNQKWCHLLLFFLSPWHLFHSYKKSFGYFHHKMEWQPHYLVYHNINTIIPMTIFLLCTCKSKKLILWYAHS